MTNLNTEMKLIKVANDFTKYPGGRYLSDGQYSGQRFREEYLAPALLGVGRVVVELDGTLGYGSSFLEEAFGGLVREMGIEPKQLLEKLELRTDNESLAYDIKKYIEDAGKAKGKRN